MCQFYQDDGGVEGCIGCKDDGGGEETGDGVGQDEEVVGVRIMEEGKRRKEW